MQLLNQLMYLLSVWYQTVLGEVTDENVYKALERRTDGQRHAGNFCRHRHHLSAIVILNKVTAKNDSEELNKGKGSARRFARRELWQSRKKWWKPLRQWMKIFCEMVYRYCKKSGN